MGPEASPPDPRQQPTASADAFLDASDPEGLVGQIVAERYRVDAVLGEGGMGAVLRAHHLGLKRDVALKVLHAELGRNKEVSARFAREAQSASRLDHPNCVHVMDFGEWRFDSKTPAMQYLAMQLLDGHELTEELGTPLQPARAVDLIVQIIGGLEHAHAHGIVHRDLKPENVFVTRDHEGKELLKLVDFGIAKIVSGEGAKDGMTRAGLIFGTPRYMSPEQGTGGEIDARTDIYSAGVMFYEMLAGRAPFDADDLVDLVRKQINEDPPPLPSDVPKALAAIVERMLAKRRAERYSDAATVRAALVEVRPQLESSSHASTLGVANTLADGAPELVDAVKRLTLPAQRFARGLDRRRKRMLAAGGGVLGLAVFLAMLWPDGDEKPVHTEDPAPAAVGNEEGLKSLLGLGEDEPREAEVAVADVPRAASEDIAEVDRLIDGKKLRAAATRLDQLIDRYPKDARLRIRRGRILARSKRKDQEALAAYTEALDLDPRILEDAAVRAELLAVMKHPQLRSNALDLAVRKLDGHGHPFLLDLVNDDDNVLGFVDRHRALDALATSPHNATKVDDKLNVALDLWQASQSLTPCESFSKALTSVEEEPDPYYLGTVHRVSSPTPGEDLPAVRKAICATLPARLESTREMLTQRYNVPAKQWEVPAAYDKRKRRRRRGLFGRVFR